MKRNDKDLEIIRIKDMLLYGIIFYVASQNKFGTFVFRYFVYGILFGIFIDILAYLLGEMINKYIEIKKKGE